MNKLSPPVIYYHSVAPALFDKWIQKFLTLPLETFEDQLDYLRVNGFRALFFDEWLAYRKGEAGVSDKEVCIAFDDGLLDNWVYAYPLAKKYGMRFTLFVSPECVDPRPVLRPTLEDVWNGRCRASELQGLGYLSWPEIKLMQQSGVVDIQSHTMTHAKYPVSDKLRGFYYGGFPGLHPILNAHPELRPNYMNDPDFEKRLPLGTPLFEEKSAAIARIHHINPDFMSEVTTLADKYELNIPEHRPVYETAAREIYRRYKEAGALITSVESEEAYRRRLEYEVVESKRIIESQLQKPVRFLCWPHGDNSHEAHAMAKAAGYLATTSGKMPGEAGKPDRIPRFGTAWDHGPWLNRQKFHYKIASHYHKQPYYALWLANEYKNKILKRG